MEYATDQIHELSLTTGPFIRFQILVFCHLNKVHIPVSQLKILTLLGMAGEADLAEFCHKIAELKIFTGTGGVRNALDRLEDMGLIVKEGTNRKKLYLSPALGICTEGVVEYKLTKK